MTRDLSRLLTPRSVVVIGGGAWCRQVVRQLLQFGFAGEIWRVHPNSDPVEGVAAFGTLADLPGVPDAAFVGVNRHETVKMVRALSGMGAGGAVCFASGFSEAEAEDGSSGDLQAALVAAAGETPILGPNCYGFINALDGALLWPDQHGCALVKRGVAILTQSSNIAINLTMQQRVLPIALVATCGNMAQTTQEELALALLDDPRITAIGLHVEGVSDTQLWHLLAERAWAKGVPIVVLKAGLSEEAQAATRTHTASLAGSVAGAKAFLSRLGIAQVHDLPVFLESLKLLHMVGPLAGPEVSAICCSGGEASLIADLAEGTGLRFPALTPDQRTQLSDALGPMVALANPLDYHTYIWGEADLMAKAWLPMTSGAAQITLLVIDYPHTDAGDWDAATEAALALRATSGQPVAVVASLPELMPAETAETLVRGGVVPFYGMREALEAVAAATRIRVPHPLPPALPREACDTETLPEAAAKALLREFDVTTPAGWTCQRDDLLSAARDLSGPFALKSSGLAHKSEAGGVRLGLAVQELQDAAKAMPGEDFLVEEMIVDGIAELLVGATPDPAHGMMLTLGAGGVLAELWQDTVQLLLPATEAEIEEALRRLRIAPLLDGYRGKPAVDLPALMDAIMGFQRCVLDARPAIIEAEINPLICTDTRAVAVDALITVAKS